jgi:hypothetical protein
MMLNTKHEQQIKWGIGIDVVVNTSVNYKKNLQKISYCTPIIIKTLFSFTSFFFPQIKLSSIMVKNHLLK